MLRLKPTYEEILREAKTRRLKILPEREKKNTTRNVTRRTRF